MLWRPVSAAAGLAEEPGGFRKELFKHKLANPKQIPSAAFHPKHSLNSLKQHTGIFKVEIGNEVNHNIIINTVQAFGGKGKQGPRDQSQDLVNVISNHSANRLQ